jgi:hypothetical protein
MAVGELTRIISAFRRGGALLVTRGIRHGGARICNVGKLKLSDQESSIILRDTGSVGMRQ